jgi:hypothetical protein
VGPATGAGPQPRRLVAVTLTRASDGTAPRGAASTHNDRRQGGQIAAMRRPESFARGRLAATACGVRLSAVRRARGGRGARAHRFAPGARERWSAVRSESRAAGAPRERCPRSVRCCMASGRAVARRPLCSLAEPFAPAGRAATAAARTPDVGRGARPAARQGRRSGPARGLSGTPRWLPHDDGASRLGACPPMSDLCSRCPPRRSAQRGPVSRRGAPGPPHSAERRSRCYPPRWR